MALLWNQAAGSINLEFISYWNSGVLAAPDNHLTHEERSVRIFMKGDHSITSIEIG